MSQLVWKKRYSPTFSPRKSQVRSWVVGKAMWRRLLGLRPRWLQHQGPVVFLSQASRGPPYIARWTNTYTAYFLNQNVKAAHCSSWAWLTWPSHLLPTQELTAVVTPHFQPDCKTHSQNHPSGKEFNKSKFFKMRAQQGFSCSHRCLKTPGA